jgi:RP/EB family microtubule-associated protein
MQWVKRFWEQNYPGGEYDALGRRKGLGSAPSVGSTRSSTTNTASSGRVSSASRKATKTPGKLPINHNSCQPFTYPPKIATRSASRGGRASVLDNHSATMIIDLNKQIAELKLTVDGLEKERDFYFGKLREIEIDVQENLEQVEMTCAEAERNVEEHEAFPVLQSIQTILYSTEEGFEVPPEDEEANKAALEEDYDDETF